jgi:hypothetical protein
MPEYYFQPTTTGGSPRKTGIFLILIGLALIALVMSSCATQKRCDAKFPPEVREIHTHSTETIRKDSVLPGATVTHTIYNDSLVLMPVNKWTVIRDTAGLAELRIYKDAYGNLLAQCEAADRTIEKIRVLEKELSQTRSQAVKTEYQTPWYLVPLVWIGGISLLILLLRLGRRWFDRWLTS